MPSGVGELVCEVFCDAVGEGYARSGRDRTRRAIVFSGSGELGGELNGEERRLAGGDESPESEEAQSIVAASGSAAREGARRGGSGVGCSSYSRDNSIAELSASDHDTRSWRVRRVDLW